MLIVCYRENGEQHYIPYESMEAFRKDYMDKPDLMPDHVFEESSDILYREQTERNAFNLYAWDYGFKFSDYGTEVILSDGNPYRLIGFKPRNRKYPCILRSSDGSSRKAAPSYIHKLMKGV